MGPLAARRILASPTGFRGAAQPMEYDSTSHRGVFQTNFRAIPCSFVLFQLRQRRTRPRVARIAQLLSMVRLPENHELRRSLEHPSARGARCMGASPSGHGTPHSRRTEASLSLAVSLADGASLSHPS